MREIKRIHKAEYRPIADLITYSPLPSRSLQQVDPFLFLNHHGFQVYPPNNNGLPFGPHPHRGIETVTFILSGDIMHMDSSGHESIITEGGIQWMTAGRGLIHSEVSSSHFKRNGGDLEILQLWINLPARLKMTEPFYLGLQKEDIPTLSINDDIQLQLIAGKWGDTEGAFHPQSDIFLSTVYLKKGAEWSISVEPQRNIFFYLVKGSLNVNDTPISERHLVEFKNEGNSIIIEAAEDSILIWGHAMPFNEPVVAHGPFVMNTVEEIHQAYEDYQNGKFGTWKW